MSDEHPTGPDPSHNPEAADLPHDTQSLPNLTCSAYWQDQPRCFGPGSAPLPVTVQDLLNRNAERTDWWLPDSLAGGELVQELSSMDIPRTPEGLRQGLAQIALRLSLSLGDLYGCRLGDLEQVLAARRREEYARRESERLERMTFREILDWSDINGDGGWRLPPLPAADELLTRLIAAGASPTPEGLRQGLEQLLLQAELTWEELLAMTLAKFVDRLKNPGQAAPGEAAPVEAAPVEAAPGEAAPGEAAPGEAINNPESAKPKPTSSDLESVRKAPL